MISQTVSLDLKVNSLLCYSDEKLNFYVGWTTINGINKTNDNNNIR